MLEPSPCVVRLRSEGAEWRTSLNCCMDCTSDHSHMLLLVSPWLPLHTLAHLPLECTLCVGSLSLSVHSLPPDSTVKSRATGPGKRFTASGERASREYAWERNCPAGSHTHSCLALSTKDNRLTRLLVRRTVALTTYLARTSRCMGRCSPVANWHLSLCQLTSVLFDR